MVKLLTIAEYKDIFKKESYVYVRNKSHVSKKFNKIYIF